MKIIYTGGGTGGHFYPLIAVAEQVRKSAYKNNLVIPTEYYFSSNNMYPDMLLSKNIKYSWVPSGKNRLYFSVLNFLDIFKLIFGFFIAFFKLLFIYPDVIFSKGGFDSVPTCIAAFILRIPIIMHDSDSIPGRASLLISKFAYRVAVSYEESIVYYKNKNNIAVTGQPMLEKYTPPTDFKREYSPNKKNILIMGGSTGSTKINDVVLSVLPKLLSNYNVIHQTGKDNLEDVRIRSEVILESYNSENYAIYSSLDFSKVYPQIDLAVSRAGSSSLFELSAWQIPAIIIPISENVSRDQVHNADVFYKKGAVKIINENNLSSNVFYELIENILEDKNIYQSMISGSQKNTHKNSSEIIALEIMDVCYSHR